MNVNKLSDEFINTRRHLLSFYLTYILAHQIVSNAPILRSFMTDTQFICNSSLLESVVDGLTDSILSYFSNVKKTDVQFSNIASETIAFYNSLTTIIALHEKHAKTNDLLVKEFNAFGTCLESFAMLEGSQPVLASFSTTSITYSKNLVEKVFVPLPVFQFLTLRPIARDCSICLF